MRDARGEHEPAVDQRPHPGMPDRSLVVAEHPAGIEHPADAVVNDRVENRDQERRPILIQGQHPDHHEEVEVGLDRARPTGRPAPPEQVTRPNEAAITRAFRRKRSELAPSATQRDQARVGGDVHAASVPPTSMPEREQRRHVEPEQPADRTVAATQHGSGRSCPGERVLKRCPVTCDPGGRASRAAAAGTIDMAARGCGGLGAKDLRDVGHRAHAVAWSLSAIWARWLGLRSAAVTGRTCSGFSATERGKPPGNSAGAGMGNVKRRCRPFAASIGGSHRPLDRCGRFKSLKCSWPDQRKRSWTSIGETEQEKHWQRAIGGSCSH